MPLPTPKTGEEKNKFISRCISVVTKSDEFDSREQVAAVCYSQWRNKNEEDTDQIVDKYIDNEETTTSDVATMDVKIGDKPVRRKITR